jgi:hypothetical protein
MIALLAYVKRIGNSFPRDMVTSWLGLEGKGQGNKVQGEVVRWLLGMPRGGAVVRWLREVLHVGGCGVAVVGLVGWVFMCACVAAGGGAGLLVKFTLLLLFCVLILCGRWSLVAWISLRTHIRNFWTDACPLSASQRPTSEPTSQRANAHGLHIEAESGER